MRDWVHAIQSRLVGKTVHATDDWVWPGIWALGKGMKTAFGIRFEDYGVTDVNK